MADERDGTQEDSAGQPGTALTGAEQSLRSADDRDRTAEDRDQIADLRDAVSETRDAKGEERDRRAEARELDAPTVDQGAVADRAGAWRDRRGGAGDRVHAAYDRAAAAKDRLLSDHERTASSLDELTGAHRRGAGMVELARDISRAQRSGQPFVVAFVDVDNLKATNDLLGHLAGDRLLRRLVSTMRAHLRPYDLIVRIGGDEFLCAIQDLNVAAATERFARINADLAAESASVTVGIAELQEDDSLDDLVIRADAALREERQRRYVPNPSGG